MQHHDHSPETWLDEADRKRLAAALAGAREARVYRRLEALLLVAEGHSVALLHGSDCARIECIRSPTSSDADGSRTPKLEHAVQGVNCDRDLCPATPVCPRA